MKPSQKLAALKLKLPDPPRPVGSYVPAVQCANMVLTSGQIPLREGKVLFTGKVPNEVSLEQAQEAARICVLNGLAAIVGVVGGVDEIQRVVRMGVFVNSAPGFTDQSKVANGASDLLVEVFGERGRHARAAVGVAELPLNAAVEVELWVEAGADAEIWH